MASSSQCHSSPCHGISLWCCSSKVMDAPAAFPTLCPSGEVMPWALSSHFTFWGPGVRGQEQSWAAPVVVTLQDWDWSWGHCQGKRERLIYPCLKVPTTRKFLIISAQGAFICQWECFDRGLLPRQAAGLVSCREEEREKGLKKQECSNTPQLPQLLQCTVHWHSALQPQWEHNSDHCSVNTGKTLS